VLKKGTFSCAFIFIKFIRYFLALSISKKRQKKRWFLLMERFRNEIKKNNDIGVVLVVAYAKYGARGHAGCWQGRALFF